MTLALPDIANGAWRFHLPGGVTIGETPFLIGPDGPQVFGAPDLRRSIRPRPGDHGVLFVGPDLLGASKIVVPVVILGTSEKDALVQAQVLAGACAPVSSGLITLTVDTPRMTWQMLGRLDPFDAPSLALVDVGAIEAIITFTASDPRLRDAIVKSLVLQAGISAGDSGYGFPHGYSHGYSSGSGNPASSGVVTNNGNAVASAVITITAAGGVLVNPIIRKTATGEALGFTITIAPGQYLITDTATGLVLLSNSPTDMTGATNRSNALNFPDQATMLHFPPGANPVAMTAQSGQGTATIAWQDTYVF